MTAVSKNVYTDKLEQIVDKCNKIYHGTIKMKPAYVKSDTFIDYCVEHINDPKFKIGDHVREWS